MSANSSTRINKYLSEVGFCSRREADKLIEQGKVTVNGKVPEKGTKISPSDEIRVNGKRITKPKDPHVYIAFNKPVGIVSTTDPKEKNNIVDYINHPKRIFHIGRLDKDSQGLILLTSDGDIVNKILRADNNHEKEYVVTVDRPITAEFIRRMESGVPILNTITKKCSVKKINQYTFNIILTQGLNRQIRRMCQYLGYNVTSLNRIRIMNIHLNTPIGKWEEIPPKQLKELMKLISSSRKTHTS